MAKMTMTIIESLYSNGQAVYDQKISLEEATEKMIQTYKGEISESSASFYISLYSDYMNGKGSTWNQNSSLVLYYVEHIAVDNGMEYGTNAFQAAMKFAKAKSRASLISDLNDLWKKICDEEAPQLPDLYEKEFYDWLREKSGKVYADNTVKRYIRALKKADEWMGITLPEPLMSISDEESFREIEERIKSNPDFDKINQERGHGDLSAAMRLYRKFLSSFSTHVPAGIGVERIQMTTKEKLSYIRDYILASGFSYEDGLIENFYLSLKSKPFVILAGTSGTGKTRLVKLFAEAVGAEYKMVSVRPDWSDGSDLFGHTDLSGNFIDGPICDAFDKAIAEPSRPVLLCLDEMNLARVEYYLSDFLSVIESRERNEDGKIVTDPIAQYKDGIPANLYIVGTVNMDETTFPFSKKVLDRANTIEFSFVDLLPEFELLDSDAEPLQLSNEFLDTEYLVLARDCGEDKEFVIQVCDELQKVNAILRKANAHVGYRVRDEIVFYMLNNKKADDLLSFEQAFDNEIMQKILPRIQGSEAAIKDLLTELFKYCMGDYSGLDTESGNAGKQMQSIADTAKYPASAMKIGYMMTRYEEDGFTSYWL